MNDHITENNNSILHRVECNATRVFNGVKRD